MAGTYEDYLNGIAAQGNNFLGQIVDEDYWNKVQRSGALSQVINGVTQFQEQNTPEFKAMLKARADLDAEIGGMAAGIDQRVAAQRDAWTKAGRSMPQAYKMEDWNKGGKNWQGAPAATPPITQPVSTPPVTPTPAPVAQTVKPLLPAYTTQQYQTNKLASKPLGLINSARAM